MNEVREENAMHILKILIYIDLKSVQFKLT